MNAQIKFNIMMNDIECNIKTIFFKNSNLKSIQSLFLKI